MATYKRLKGKRIKRGETDYNKATWIAEGQVDGVRYHQTLKDAKNKSDADRFENEIIIKIRHGEYDLHTDKTTFAGFIEKIYLPYCRLNNASYKQKTYEVNFLKTFFKGALLKNISPQKCEEYKTWRLDQKKRCQKCISNTHGDTPCLETKVSTSTVNRELTTLKKLLNVAVANRKIKENPMRFVSMLAEPPPRERFLTDDEKRRLFEAIGSDKRLLAIVLIGLLTGWRKGQILSVRKKDLDFERKAVSIIKSKRNPARKVPVSQAAWNIFEALAGKADDYLFTNKEGNQLGDFKESWWNALKKAEIEDFHYHDIRRSAATELLHLGANAFTIQTALGHSSINQTAIYAKAMEKDLRSALDEMGEGYLDYLN